MIIGLMAWIAMAIGAGAVASSKNRSFFGYFVLGFVFPFIGLLIAIGMAPRAVGQAPQASGSLLPWLAVGAIGIVVMLALTSK